MALVYALSVVAAVLTLNPYFSRTWDAVTFAHAARSFLNSADWMGLYAQSRIERYWPFAYPPLHALVIAPLLAIGAGVPDWLWARVPPLAADIGTGLLLYTIVARRTREQGLARLALVVWLLNPVTFYDTAVQGHFEAEWLFFVLLAYLLAESRRGILLPTLALACGFLFKQTSALFAIPYWLSLAFPPDAPNLSTIKRFIPVGLSIALFGAVVLIISLPFLLYSGDYLYMTIQYVTDVPLQTQSWLVALAGIFGPDFLFLRLSSSVILLATLAISFFSARRGWSLYLTGSLITLAFFLLSSKVAGYYYVILIPFALVAFLPARRFGLLALIVASTAWISLSPYFASWADPNHLSFYAALGTVNSLLWLAFFIYLVRHLVSPLLHKEPQEEVRAPLLYKEGQGEVSPSTLSFLSIVLFIEAVAAALLQPLVDNPTSPIRAPLVPPGSASSVLFASILFAVIILGVFFLAIFRSRGPARNGGSQARPWVFAIALGLAPVYFLTYTCTKESTAFVEIALKSLGL